MIVHIGKENYINLDEVYAIGRNKGETMRKARLLAAKNGLYQSFACGDPTRSLIFMKNGMVFGSCVTAKTLKDRFNIAKLTNVAINPRVFDDDDEDDIGDNDEYYLDETFAEETEDDGEDDE